MEGTPLSVEDPDDQESRRKKELGGGEGQGNGSKKPENIGFFAIGPEPSALEAAWAKTERPAEDSQPETPAPAPQEGIPQAGTVVSPEIPAAEAPEPAPLPPLETASAEVPMPELPPAPEAAAVAETPEPAPQPIVEAAPPPEAPTPEPAPVPEAPSVEAAPIEVPSEPVELPAAELTPEAPPQAPPAETAVAEIPEPEPAPAPEAAAVAETPELAPQPIVEAAPPPAPEISETPLIETPEPAPEVPEPAPAAAAEAAVPEPTPESGSPQPEPQEETPARNFEFSDETDQESEDVKRSIHTYETPARAATVPELTKSSRAAEERMDIESAPRDPAAGGSVEALSRAELLDIAAEIKVDGNSLKHAYDTRIVGERGLRRLIEEYRRGGDMREALRREILEHEIDFERDPAMRDLASQQAPAANDMPDPAPEENPFIEKLLQNADDDGDDPDKEALVESYARHESDDRRSWQTHHRSKAALDALFVSVISILLLLVLFVYLSRR